MKINKICVLGAGTMGSQIAALLSSLGFKTYLLDIVPKEGKDRNKIVKDAIQRLKKQFPPPLYLPEFADDIEIGNFEDNLEIVKKVDWIIEAVVENLEIKKNLFKKVENFYKEGTIVTTNTSGLPLKEISSDFKKEMKRNFFGTHFFNPPRFMKLLEIIPGPETDKNILEEFKKFAERKLGKGIVIAKDTPNFIANRIGVFGIMYIFKLMEEMDLKPEEIDALTGKAMGRPKTATFRTLDLVGLDVLYHVAKTVYERATNDEMREIFKPPEFLEKMIKEGLLGDKTQKGFYKKEKVNGETKIYTFDIKNWTYREQSKASFPSLERAMQEDNELERIKFLINGKDKGAEFAYRSLSELLLYCANRIPEISDDVLNIDNAMKWGFGWKYGPFEIWDYLGVKEFTKRMESDGKKVPDWVKEIDSFYKKDKTKRHFYFYPERNYKEEIKSKYEVYISDLKEEKKTLKENNEATLYDMGEDVLLLEFHTKANAIGPGIVEMVFESIDFLENSNYAGMVIGNQGEHFSAGANLYLILMAIQEEEWDEIDLMVRKFQEMNMRIKYSNKPIVTAPFGRVLGGGCEIVLHSPYVQASSELYMGLVEIAVGLLPAGGGTKEMLLRHNEIIPEGINVDFYPYLRRILEIIGMAKVSSSAFEAKKYLFLRDRDGITINQDHLLYDAKRKVIELNEIGFQRNRKKKIKVEGRDGYFYLEMLIYNLLEAKQITEHEALIAKKISEILTVKDVPRGTEVTEETLLDLERENFLFLCGTQKTRERIEHMLLKGKPLRN
ncbi:MAG: 3-hydroxyacyl-CoA dehydrogenase NAD-binding domain-containing protein [candidate division WOR-3 bacterium]